MKLDFKLFLLLNLINFIKINSMQDPSETSGADLSKSSDIVANPSSGTSERRVFQRYFSWIGNHFPPPNDAEITEYQEWQTKVKSWKERLLIPTREEHTGYNKWVEDRGEALFNVEKLPDFEQIQKFYNYFAYLKTCKDNKSLPDTKKLEEINQWVRDHKEFGLSEIKMEFFQEIKDESENSTEN